MMKKAFRTLQAVLNALTGIAIATVILIIFVQVIMRYVFFHSLPWSEELCRYLFIWLIVLGLNIAIREHMEIRIDIVESLFKSEKAKDILRIFQGLASLAAIGILTYSSKNLVVVGFRSISASMHIPMYIIYSAVPVGCALATIQVVMNIAELICDFIGRGDKQ